MDRSYEESKKLYFELHLRFVRDGSLPVGTELPCLFDHNGECLICPESAWPSDCPFKLGNKEKKDGTVQAEPG